MRFLSKNGMLVASVAALALACGGGDKNQQAQAPTSGTTTTTGANGTTPMQAQDQQMQQPQGYTFDQSQPGGMTGQGGTMGSSDMGGGSDTSGIGGGSAPVDQGIGTSGTSGAMGQGSTGTTSADQGTSGAGGGQKAKTERALNDAEIFAVETAANEGEIQMADLARKSARSAQVKNFAQMMVTEHRNAQNKAKQIAQKAKITATDNEVSNQLKSDVQSMVSDLKSQKGADFDKMYIDDQVKAHRNVLDIVDNRLLPNVSDSDLKTHLTDVRSKVSDHLSKAEDIQTKLGQQPVGAAGTTGGKSGTPSSKAKGGDTTKPKDMTDKDNKDKDKTKSPDTTDHGGMQGGGGTHY